MDGAEDRPGRFLARWSRLKREARAGAAPADPPARMPPAETPPAEAAAGAEEAFDPAALPRIEDLTSASDITAFLRKGVPTALRNAALRRMWSLDPAIRDYIGPVDYGWDWNTPGGVPDFVDNIGEGPAIRALAEKLLSPAPSPHPAAPREAPGSAEAREAETTAARLRPAAEPPPAEVVPPESPPDRPEDRTAPGPALAARPRHGGAMPA